MSASSRSLQAKSAVTTITSHDGRQCIAGVCCRRMRSAVTLGVVFIAMGGLSISGIAGRHPLGPVSWGIAGLLVAAGIALLTRRPFAFYLALLAGTVTAATGVLPYLHHPELPLPMPPLLSIVVGLHLIGRTTMLRVLAPDKSRGHLPRHRTPDCATAPVQGSSRAHCP